MEKKSHTHNLFAILSSAIVLVAMLPIFAQAYQCKSELYDNLAFLEPKDSFSIKEKVYIKITCDELPEADLEISVSWYNTLGELFRSDSQDIVTKQGDSRMIYFWIKLQQKGKLTSSYDDKLFSDKSYGQWKVESYVTDKANNDFTKIVSKQFTLK